MTFRLRRLGALLSLFVLALALSIPGARAQLTIEIIGGGGTTIPIAIVPFAGAEEPARLRRVFESVAATRTPLCEGSVRR